MRGLPPGTSSARLVALQQQQKDELDRDLTFKPNTRGPAQYEPKDNFATRQKKAEEARRLKLVRAKQDEFEREIQSMASQPMNERSKVILSKRRNAGTRQRFADRMHAQHEKHAPYPRITNFNKYQH